MITTLLARLRAIDPRRLRRPFTHLRREYGVYGEQVWDFYGTDNDWARFRRALDDAPDD